MHRLTRVVLLVVMALAWPAGAGAQRRYINGLFVRTPTGIVELIAYAEPRSAGHLRMVQGDLEDVPIVDEIHGILASLQFWKPVGVIVATTVAFRDDRAERRVVPIVQRMLNVYTTDVRASDLERREKVESLLRAVGATAETPGFAFVVMVVDGAAPRYYPVRLTPDER